MSEPRADLNLRQLEVFVRVFESRSVSAGARNLGLTQPTASAHLKGMEEALSTVLFRRAGRAMEPTAAAERLYPVAARVLLGREELLEAVRGSGQGLVGDLTIGASNIPSTWLLPPRLAKFTQRHPAARLRVETGDSRAVLDALDRGSVEIAYVGAEPDKERFESRPFAKDRMLLIAAKTHPLAGRVVAPNTLCGHPFVLRERGSGTRRAAERALHVHGISFGSDLPIALEVGSNEAAREAVRAGIGLSFLSEVSAREAIASKDLVIVRVRGLELERSFFTATARGRRLGAMAQAFLDAS